MLTFSFLFIYVVILMKFKEVRDRELDGMERLSGQIERDEHQV